MFPVVMAPATTFATSSRLMGLFGLNVLFSYPEKNPAATDF